MLSRSMVKTKTVTSDCRVPADGMKPDGGASDQPFPSLLSAAQPVFAAAPAAAAGPAVSTAPTRAGDPIDKVIRTYKQETSLCLKGAD